MEAPFPIHTLMIPSDLKCPITNRLFNDPVTAADGYHYERSAIVKHMEISLKSPVSGKLLLHTNLSPNQRKQQQASSWLSALGDSIYMHAVQCSLSTESGSLNRDSESFDLLVYLKEVAGVTAFVENADWASLSVTVAERVLAPLMAANSQTSFVERFEDSYPKLAPLRLLYDVYLSYYVRDAQCPTKDDFIRVRGDLAKCLFAIGEHGHLEAVLRDHRELNTAPLWRLLVNEQTAFGRKKEAARSCMRMATFAETNGMTALATTAREEALTLDPNVKADGSEFASLTFMTKEELRAATRDEIVGSFLSDPNNQHNYEHLIDFLEDEGSVVNAVRVIVAHALTKNVPTQFQASAALPLRRLVTLVAHLQSKYVPQLQILSTEANNRRAVSGQEALLPPDLVHLLSQPEREEEYRKTTVSLLETIAKKVSPPISSGSIAIPSPSNLSSSVSASSASPSSPTSLTASPPISAIESSAPMQMRTQQRSSWGIKPQQGKDRNKRFTMGIKAPMGGFGSRSEHMASPASGHSAITITSAAPQVAVSSDPSSFVASAAKGSPGHGRPPANFVWGPGSGQVRIGGPPTNVENPIFSQPLVPPGRLHTPSALTPFDGTVQGPVTSSNVGTPLLQLQGGAFVVDDSPFSATMFNGMPDQLTPISPRRTSEDPPPPPDDEFMDPKPVSADSTAQVTTTSVLDTQTISQAPSDTDTMSAAANNSPSTQETPVLATPVATSTSNASSGDPPISTVSTSSNSTFTMAAPTATHSDQAQYSQSFMLGNTALSSSGLGSSTSSLPLNSSTSSLGSTGQSLSGSNFLNFSSSSTGSLLYSSTQLAVPQNSLASSPGPLDSMGMLTGPNTPSHQTSNPISVLQSSPPPTSAGTMMTSSSSMSTITTTSTPPPRMQSPLTGPSLSSFSSPVTSTPTPNYSVAASPYAFGNPALSNPALAGGAASQNMYSSPPSGLLPPTTLNIPQNTSAVGSSAGWNPAISSQQNPALY